MLKFIVNYIKAIRLKYKSIKKVNALSFPLRIVAKKLVNNDTIYTVQIVRKNLVFKLCATELFNDNKLLKGLSPYDLLKVLNNSKKKTFYNNNNLLTFPCRAQYKMVAKNYDHNSQQTIFIVEITQANHVTQKKFTALEILNNPLILEKLSYQETYDLGFTVGSEAILKEVQKLACLK